MGILMIKRNIRRRGVGFFSNFSYSGEMEKDLSQTQPRIRFLTSGILIPKAAMTIDAWLLGGGGGGAGSSSTGAMGGGGGSGYTLTAAGIELIAGNQYAIVIGTGGNAGVSDATGLWGTAGFDGSTTEAFGHEANGGVGGGKKSFPTGTRFSPAYGGGGGSGGGAGSLTEDGKGGAGGTDGANGQDPSGGGYFGYGNGTSTTEFADGGKLYASGGSGGSYDGTVIPGGEGGGGATGENGQPNTGGGGGGADKTRTAGSGGSGIVVIRKAVG